MRKSLRFVFLPWCVMAMAAGFAARSAAAEEDVVEAGFERLFRGAALTAWERTGNAGFSIRDGVLLCNGTGHDPAWLRSRAVYENFVLRFQYRMTSYANGGILLHAPLHGRMSAVGLLIKLSDDTPKSRPTFTSTGGVFGVQPPNCLSGLVDRWMDVEILCDYPRLAVTVNGRIVQDLDVRDDRLLRNRPRSGFLGFQDGGHRVEYRKVRIKRLPGTEKAWVSLFHDDTLAGWNPIEGNAAWRVEDRVLIAEEGRGYLASQSQYRDFELMAYIHTEPGSNGGIFCRFNTLPSDRGFEIQIEDNRASGNPTGSIYNHRRACCLPVRAGTWYPLQIVVQGRHGTVCVNGVPVVETDSLPVDRAGHIVIQLHDESSRIRIKEMKIKVLDGQPHR